MKKFFVAVFSALLCLFLCTYAGATASSASAQEYTLEEAQNETNAFRISRVFDEKITLTYIFPVNSAIFENSGCTESQIKIFRFYLSIYVATLASQNRENASSGVEVGQVTYFDDIDGIGFSIIFDDLQAQQTFFESDSSSSTKIESSGFFVQKTSVFVDFPISKNGADNLKKVVSLAIASWAQSEGISDISPMSEALEDSFFIYEFASADSILMSELMTEDELTRNFFVRTYQTLEEKMCFYVISPNVPVFYALTLLLTILSMLIAYFALKNRKKPQKFELTTKKMRT